LDTPCVIVTDSVERAETFFNRASCPEPADLSGHCDPALKDLLFGPGSVHAITVPNLAVPARFRLLILQKWAGRSNLEMLTEAQRKGIAIPDGLVCGAVAGKDFVGRFDRSWQCVGGNLHAVVHLEPGLTLQRAGPAFSILAAVACVDAVRVKMSGANREAEDGPPAPRIKWINDVYLGTRKVAGVLTRQTYHDPVITDVFLGIGVNVLSDPDVERDRFVPAVGSLASILPGPEWAPGLFLVEFLRRVDYWYDRLLADGVRPLLESYSSHSNVLNRSVRIYEDGFGLGSAGGDSRRLVARGRVVSVLDDLSLRLEGVSRPIAAGRLAFDSDCD